MQIGVFEAVESHFSGQGLKRWQVFYVHDLFIKVLYKPCG